MKDNKKLEFLVKSINSLEETHLKKTFQSQNEYLEEKNANKFRKEARSSSKDNRSPRESDEIDKRSFVQRSNSVTRGRPNLPRSTPKEQFQYTKGKNAFLFSTNIDSKLSKTFSFDKGITPYMNSLSNLESNQIRECEKNTAFYHSIGRNSANGYQDCSFKRHFSPSYHSRDKYFEFGNAREKEYEKVTNEQFESSFEEVDKEERASQLMTGESDRQDTSICELKNEIVSLENEIGEIDRYMKEQLDTENLEGEL